MKRARHPTVELSADKRALLDLLLEAEGVSGTPDERIARRTPSSATPPSFSQQRLWFLDQLVPGNSFYNISAALRLRTALSAAVLERSLNEMVRRHEALRTVFPTNAAGEPMQQVLPELRLELAVADLRMLGPTEREAQALRLATEEARRPFDLARGPLLRAGLLQLGAADHVFLLTLHHIVADGWSLGIFARELTALYAAFAAGRASPLPELPIQYADFALWQRGWLQGEVLEAQLRYWTAQLKDLPVLQLPTDRRRPAVQTYQGASHPLVLPPSLVGALRQLGQREGVTLFMTLLAAFKVLLHRYSGQDDILTGVPVAGRNRAETEGLIGFFVNTLVMRTDLSGDPTFRTLLQRVRDVALGAYAHQDLPFEMLVEKLQPERDLSRNPLFQVTFQLLNVPGTPQDSAGAVPMDVQRMTSLFDIAVNMVERAHDVTGVFEYDTDLFESATIARMARHYQTLLEALVAQPDAHISVMPLLTDTERQQLLVSWNATRADYPRHMCVHELFEAQAVRTPDATAVVFRRERVTYEALNRRANQLAHYLRRHGVGRESLIGIHLDASSDMVVALLAVLKAGAAYVPLDTRYPVDRLAYMLGDTCARVVLTCEQQGAALPQSQTLTICVDRDAVVISRESGGNPTSGVTPDHLAYVIYTSGSTGRPKEVMVPHRALVNYVSWCTTAYRVADGRGSPVHSPIGFDLTVTSLFPALLAGRTVWLLPESNDVEALAQLLRSERDFSLIKITPAHLELLSHQLRPIDVMGCVRAVVVGGEALTSDAIAFWREHGPDARLINEYGPTESVVGCCVYEVPAGFPGRGAMVPIGRPIANTRLYLLDSRMQLVPVGVPGELYIAGDGVARGYLNQPEATAEKFVWDPFTVEAESRMYRTGDLARYLPDGNLEFLGRIDRQVKIRGYRIEPGEIEAVLSEHPDVKEAIVLAADDAVTEKRLTAYVVCSPPLPTASALRAFLGSILPSHMLPSAFVFVDQLPLTANGKIDLEALEARSGTRAVAQGEYAPPRTPVEEGIAAIWRDLLGVARVGVHDNFFELGGHSLLATQVMSRIRKTLDTDMPLRVLFDNPTVTDLAAAVMARLTQPLDDTAPPIVGVAARFDRASLPDLDRLSDDEVQRQLNDLLANGK